jgi:hypothetical protein
MPTTTILIQTDEYIIEQDSTSPHLHTITFPPYTNSQILIDSIVKTQILLGTTTTINKENNQTKLFFNATSISQLKKKHHYNQSLRLLYHLTKQINYLIQHAEHCFLGYSPDHAIIIDENKCIYLSSEHLQPIHNKKYLSITYPFSKDDFFLSPELKNVREIPSQIHYKTSYYSLACLIIHSLSDPLEKEKEEKEKEEEEEEEEEQYKNDKVIDNHSIKGTPMYWLLKRCLSQEPENRSIIYF